MDQKKDEKSPVTSYQCEEDTVNSIQVKRNEITHIRTLLSLAAYGRKY